jgi:Bacteriophage tail sheath protein
MANDPPHVPAPGIFVTELPSHPPTITGVETAVPVFIGYTEFATVDEKPASLQLVPIASAIEYEAAFGGRYVPAYRIEQGSPRVHDFMAQRWDAARGAFALAHYVIPGSHQGTQTGATGRPLRFNLHDSIRLFYANGGGRCFVVSVGDYAHARKSDTPIDAAQLRQGLDVAAEHSGPTMLVVPDAVLLAASGSRDGMPVSSDFDALVRAMLAQCERLQDRVAILDVFAADALRPRTAAADLARQLGAVAGNFRASVGDDALGYGMAYFPFLATSVVGDEVDYAYVDPGGALAVLQKILVDAAAFAHPDATAPGPATNGNSEFLRIERLIDAMASTQDRSTPEGRAAIAALNHDLVTALPLLAQIEDVVRADLGLLPPSGALAGVYAQTDTTRGVWKAPANVALQAVAAPSLAITNAQQDSLNAPPDGKAIDVIRTFVGKGTLVWGARTLDGNSNEWRYVNVRRTVICIEQSIKNGLEALMFEPNEAKTWVTVTGMVENFLTTLWRQGALQGVKPEQAFFAHCGLGITMTGQDILDGKLIVEVGVALVRPAEFIILRLFQRMLAAT